MLKTPSKMATISGHSFNIGPYGKYVYKFSSLKPVSQFKANMAWMVLMWSIFKIVSSDLTSIQDGHYPRTIHAMFALNWLTSFRREDFYTIFSKGPMLKLCSLTAAILNRDRDHWTQFGSILFKASMAWMVLKWSFFKIVSGYPELHPRWPPSADIL
jgi:hypothetical protein